MKQLREKVKTIANVDDCSVIRVLPDTLIFQITERVPRAFLGNVRSPWVVDGKGIIMHRKQSMTSYNALPVITDVNLRGARVGKELQSIRPAVDLIMMTVHSFPDFKIYRISMKNPDKMKILLKYRKFPIYQVLLPVKNRGLSLSFHVLQSAIINAKKNNETRTHYDLSYDNNVVIN
jgi:cell division septal protein FtsQ